MKQCLTRVFGRKWWGFAGGIAGQLTVMRKADFTPTVFLLGGDVGQADASIFQDSIPIDPRLILYPDLTIQKWLCCHDYCDDNFANHNELRYGMLGMVDDNADCFTVFASIRGVGQQPFSETSQQCAQRFGGHLQRALHLQQHTQNLQTQAELSARAIDALALSMLIVDDKGVILHCNVGAERLLNTPRCGLTCKIGHLSVSNPVNKPKLTALISEATGYPAVGGAMFLDGGETRQLFVTPLPASSPFARDWQTPLALILVMDAAKNLSALHILGALYDLSPAELRVASALLKGQSPEEYAQEAAVAINTVRSQLRNLFSKTNTRRQSELVAVLSRVPPLHN